MEKLGIIKMIKRYGLVDLSFIFIIIMIIVGGAISAILTPKDINYYENRPANTFPIFTIKGFVNGDFQERIDSALSDQLPLTQTMKKGYNFGISIVNKRIIDYAAKCNPNNYIVIEGLLKYRDHLCYYPRSLNEDKEDIDKSTTVLNKLLDNSIDTYCYYIETDKDINFETNENSGCYDYIKSNLNIPESNCIRLNLNSYEDFSRFFYKTDHHWNNEGSYKAYCDIINLIKPNDEVMLSKSKVLVNPKMCGSKAALARMNRIYSEKAYIYTFDREDPDIYINRDEEKKEYGIVLNPEENTIYPPGYGYAGIYGGDFGEVVFDTGRSELDNILIISSSYDNAIDKLIAQHFNKTYAVDLRAYEMDIGKKFDLNEYIKEMEIDKLLFVVDKITYLSLMNLEVN